MQSDSATRFDRRVGIVVRRDGCLERWGVLNILQTLDYVAAVSSSRYVVTRVCRLQSSTSLLRCFAPD